MTQECLVYGKYNVKLPFCFDQFNAALAFSNTTSFEMLNP